MRGDQFVTTYNVYLLLHFPPTESNEMRFFSTLRQRFALSSDLQADVKALVRQHAEHLYSQTKTNRADCICAQVAMSENMLEQRLQEAGMAGLPQWKSVQPYTHIHTPHPHTHTPHPHNPRRKAIRKQKQRSDKRRRKVSATNELCYG